LPQAPVAYLPPPPVYSWTGLYIGLNGGGASGNSNFLDPVFGNSGSFNMCGALLGGTIGANYQIGQFVLGLEGDGHWQSLDNTKQLARHRARPRRLCLGSRALLRHRRRRDCQCASGRGRLAISELDANRLDRRRRHRICLRTELERQGRISLCRPSCGLGSCGSTTATVSLNENIIRGGFNFKFGGPGGFGFGW
jgi:hypothetical protein